MKDALSPAADALPLLDYELRVPDYPYGYDFLQAAKVDKCKGSLYYMAGHLLTKVWLARRQFNVLVLIDKTILLEPYLQTYRDFIKTNHLDPKIALAAVIWSAEMCGEIPILGTTDELFPPELQASHLNNVPFKHRISCLLWEENLCVCGVTHYSCGGSSVEEPIVVSSGLNTPEPEAAALVMLKADFPIKLKGELGAGSTRLMPPTKILRQITWLID
ncbi:hypothetical protein Dda_7061 [Drechslerella dactyloides]|uniref:Uncharacterized protein n=1 Tax=Drechslerella dactyloides TaxID=74499 RepID=A0AAD6NH72_DREDA|nr:hypothetical protein Dda_7061 [Drechslerella dactyloides]